MAAKNYYIHILKQPTWAEILPSKSAEDTKTT